MTKIDRLSRLDKGRPTAFIFVLERNPSDRRLNIRGINNCLLAYKYGEEGASSSEDENPDLSIEGPQDQVSIGQIIETEDGKERVIAVDGQGSYVTEVLDQEGK